MTEDSATKPTPWGVALKKTPKGRNPVPNRRRAPGRLNKDAKAEESIQNKRANLRPTQTRPRRTRSKKNEKTYTRPASRGWKLRDTSTPLFGVVLRRLGTINEDEEFCDLDLMAVEARTQSKIKPNLRSFGKSDEMDNSTNTRVANSFGVRLKPNRNAASCTRQRPSRTKSNSVAPAPSLKTYQIDLNPTQKSDSGKDKSFLEVKLRPVPKPVKDQPTTVEFQLRHVVAPANGGPHQTASQALFQVPLLKPIKSPADRQNWKPTTEQGLQDVLQVGISNLSPPVAKEDGVTLQSIQIQAKQVDPETQEVQLMNHVIDVELRHKEGDVEAKENSTIPEWTMKVNLKKEGEEKEEEEPIITVKPVTKPTKNDDSSDDDDDDDDGFAKEADGAMLDCDYGGSSTEEEEVFSGDEFGEDSGEDVLVEDGDQKKKKKKKRFRKKKKQTGEDDEYEYFEECSDSEYEEVTDEEEGEDEDEYEEITDDEEEEEIVEEGDTSTADTAESTENTEADKKEEEPAPEPEEEKKEPPASEPRKPKKKDPPVELTEEKRKDLVLWYNRLNCPNRKKMIEKVKKLPADCHITPEDVEALPWMPGGFMLDQRILNKMILEDWQGVEEKK